MPSHRSGKKSGKKSQAQKVLNWGRHKYASVKRSTKKRIRKLREKISRKLKSIKTHGSPKRSKRRVRGLRSRRSASRKSRGGHRSSLSPTNAPVLLNDGTTGRILASREAQTGFGGLTSTATGGKKRMCKSGKKSKSKSKKHSGGKISKTSKKKSTRRRKQRGGGDIVNHSLAQQALVEMGGTPVRRHSLSFSDNMTY
jgi:hypothetical protein